MLHTALHDVNPDVVGWMPAHLTAKEVTQLAATKSDGSPVSKQDVWANDLADRLAKLGAEHFRVPPEEVRRWKQEFNAVKARAKWIGQITHEANNVPDFPFRDTEAARWKALAAQRSRADRKAKIDGRRRRGARQKRQTIPPHLGGTRS